jgi:hypothetical protein
MLVDSCVNTMLDAVTLDLASLHSAFHATGGNEIAGGSPAYARKAITMGTSSARVRSSSTAPVFDVPASTVAFVGLWTNAGTVFRGMFPLGGTEKGFQVDLENNRVACEAHGLVQDDRVVFIGGTPPAGTTEGTLYFVVAVQTGSPATLHGDVDTFQVSATLGGAAIDLTGQHAPACKVSKIVPEVFAAQGTYTVNSLTIGATE